MKKLIFSMLLIVVLVIAGAASCSSSSQSTAENEGIILSSTDKGDAVMSAPGAAPAPLIGMARDESAQTVTGGGSSSYAESSGGVSVTSADMPSDLERMIIKTGNISLVVEDVTGAIDQIKQLADNYGGYVVSSSVWMNDDKPAGSINFRVDADKFDPALSSLRNLAVEVTYENTSSQDVTEEYVDLSATLSNLEATEQQFLVIMDKAKTVEDILAVQKELSQVRNQIETTKGRMQYLEQTSATSIIYVQLQESTMYFQYSADKTRGVKAGEKIQFTVSDISGGFAPYTYLWNFGDGDTSTDENPVHAYGDTGYYTIDLTVTDDNGNTESVTRGSYIYVQPGWNAGNIAGKAWNGLASFGRGLVNALIWIGIFSPVWLVIGGVIIWIRRRRKNRTA